MGRIKYHILLLLFIWGLFIIRATSQVQFEHYSIKDGLSNNSVKQIIQDQKGFLWFGTLNGLDRFDGKQIRSYTMPRSDNLIHGNIRIHKLYEDKLNYLWISTFEDQIVRFDPRSEKFVSINSYNHDPVQLVFLCETSPGVLWFRSYQDEIVRIIDNEDDDRFNIEYYKSSVFIPNRGIHFIYPDKVEGVWIGTGNGLLFLVNDRVSLTEENITPIISYDSALSFTCVLETDNHLLFGTEHNGLYSYKDKQLLPFYPELSIHTSIQKILNSGDNNLIVITNGQGFFYLELKNKRNHQFSLKNTRNPDLDNTYIDVYEDRLGLFWLISSRRGVTLFNPENLEIKYFGLNPEYRESPGEEDKQTILEDSYGDLWIGIYGGGIYKFNRNTKDFDHYCYNRNNPYGLSSNFILTLFEDASKNLWIGTFQGGINKLMLSRNNFLFTEPKENAIFESENEVRSLLEDGYGRLWVGTKDGHVFCYNNSGELLFTIPEDLKSYNHQFTKHNVYSLLDDKNGNLWIGTKGEGLIRIEGILSSKQLKGKIYRIDKFEHDPSNPSSLSYNDIYTLHQDHIGQIWVGTYFGGIDLIENPSGQIVFKHYKSDPEDNHSLSDNRVRCFFQDKENNLWIGTSDGLNFLSVEYMDKNDKQFKIYNDNVIPASLLVFDIHQDKDGNIWIATFGSGLNVLKEDSAIKTENFQQFLVENGLTSNVIYSILEDPDNNLWLGTDNGLCKFTTNGRTIEKYIAKEGTGHDFYSEGTCLKTANGDFVFGNKSGFVRFNPDKIKQDTAVYPLVLTDFKIFDERMVPGTKNSPLARTLENTERIQLKYNQNFICIEFAVLDYKSPGRIQYAFILENLEDKWNYISNQNKAVYRGLPPGHYIFKVKATNSNGIWMDTIRELSITISPPIWKTELAYCLYIFLLIMFIWLVTYFILKEIKMRNKINYEKRLTEDKLMFYTNISHEFKTPLTLINNSTDDLLESNVWPVGVRDKITIIKKNSMRLHNLIEQLMDFRRIQKGKMELKTIRMDIISYFKDIYQSFVPFALKKNINFQFRTNVKGFEGWIDPKHIDKIVTNLLSNAFKHTPDNKNIAVDVQIDTENKILYFKVIDEGDGISSENLGKIFDRFAFFDRDTSSYFKSTGIGLALTSDLVTLHKGKISVESELNQGSHFSVQIPIGKTAYKDDERDENAMDIQQPETLSIQLEELNDGFEPQDLNSYGKTSSATKSRILIVEDNDELRNYLASKLKKNFIVYLARDGEEGLNVAGELDPDLIVSDVKMPKMDGLALTREIKMNFNTSHIPVVLLTAKSSIEHQIEGLDFGADDYIMKPFNMKYLQKRIENIISQRKILKEKFSMDPVLKPEKLTDSDNDQKFLTEVTRIVEDNMKTPNFSIETIIEEMGFSRTLFYKKIKGILDTSPKEFIRTIKMKKAAALLRESESSVAQVSYEVGYNDPDYFGKSFKNYFGETPSEYQKRYK